MAEDEYRGVEYLGEEPGYELHQDFGGHAYRASGQAPHGDHFRASLSGGGPEAAGLMGSSPVGGGAPATMPAGPSGPHAAAPKRHLTPEELLAWADALQAETEAKTAAIPSQGPSVGENQPPDWLTNYMGTQ